MGRAPCCEKMGLKKGPWTPEEDNILISHIEKHGHSNWRALPKQAGLLRCGKSCRLRWINYLKPDIKRGNFTEEEEETIIKLHEMIGNRWSAIAAKLPKRTDNEIKNVWHTHLKKKLKRRQESSNDQLQPQGHDPTITGQSQSLNSQIENIPAESMSPQPSISEISTSTANSAATSEIKQEDIDSSVIFPVIDESFWSETEMLESSGTSMSFDDLGVEQFELGTNFMEFDKSDDSMDFWFNVLMKNGGLEELL